MAAAKKHYGVIDVGSNSIRLSVYVPSEGAYPLKKVFDEKQPVGLAAYINNGLLNSEGIRAAAKAVKRQVTHAGLLGCQDLNVFATAALRNCANSQAAVDLLTQMIDRPVDLISGQREAELGFAGIQPEFDLESGWIADIGGGSTELSVVQAGQVASTVSFSFGSLSLWHRFVEGVVPSEDEFDACRANVRSALDDVSRDIFFEKGDDIGAFSSSPLFGIGGSVRTAAKLWAGYETLLSGQQESVAVPDSLSNKQIEEMINFALRNPGDYGHLIARVEPTRIHTAALGLVILSELLHWTGAKRVLRSKHGIREGYILSCMM